MKRPKMNIEELTEFISSWNNDDKVNKNTGTKPFNEYALHALLVSPGFTIKFFVSKEEFDDLKMELGSDINYLVNTKDRLIFFSSADDRIEIEIDNFGVYEKYNEDMKDLREIFNSLPDLNKTK